MTIHMNRGQFEHYCNWAFAEWPSLRAQTDGDPVFWLTRPHPRLRELERRGRGLYGRSADGTHYDLRWQGSTSAGRPVCTAKRKYGKSWQGRGRASGAAAVGLFESGMGVPFRDAMGIEVVYEDEYAVHGRP